MVFIRACLVGPGAITDAAILQSFRSGDVPDQNGDDRPACSDLRGRKPVSMV